MGALRNEKIYTVDDIYALPDGIRVELVDGQIYYMSAPTRTHQRIHSSLGYLTPVEYRENTLKKVV